MWVLTACAVEVGATVIELFTGLVTKTACETGVVYATATQSRLRTRSYRSAHDMLDAEITPTYYKHYAFTNIFNT